MMTRGHRQEALSRAYVHAVAAQAGVLTSRPDPDYGIDLCLRGVEVRGNRYLDSGIQIDLQLKSTTRAKVTKSAVAYDLDVEGYDILRESDPSCLRYLVVLVLPADESQWFCQTSEELVIRHCAYWLSLEGRPAKTAKRTVRVSIPLANVLSVEAVQDLLQQAKRRQA
jgi:Domain of unknown function (DUF4365)